MTEYHKEFAELRGERLEFWLPRDEKELKTRQRQAEEEIEAVNKEIERNQEQIEERRPETEEERIEQLQKDLAEKNLLLNLIKEKLSEVKKEKV